MDQPIDFSGKMKTTNLTVKKQLQRINSMNSLRNGRNEIHSLNSEISDECASRSSSSPDSCTGQLSPKFLNTLSSTLNNNINGNLNETLNNTINSLSVGQNAFSQALMIAAVNQNLAMNLNSQMLINNSNSGLNPINNFSNLGLMSNANLNPSLTMNSFAKPVNSKKVNSVKRNFDNSKQLNSSQQALEEPCTTNSLQFLLTEPNSSKIGNKVPKTSATKANKSQQRKTVPSKKQSKKENSFETMLDDSNEMSLDSNIFQLSVNSNSSQDEHFFNSQLDKDLSLDSNGRRRGQPIPSHMKDEIYWLRRRKNNEAAKKSRDAKRAKDLMTAKRALSLENENSNLHNELILVKNENVLLKSLLKENSLIDDFNKNHIEKLIAQGASMDPEKIFKFSTEFVKNFGI